MQELVDSSDHGRRNKGEMEDLIGLARWRRGCRGTCDATADKISLIGQQLIQTLCVLLLPVLFSGKVTEWGSLNFVAPGDFSAVTFFALLLCTV